MVKCDRLEILLQIMKNGEVELGIIQTYTLQLLKKNLYLYTTIQHQLQNWIYPFVGPITVKIISKLRFVIHSLATAVNKTQEYRIKMCKKYFNGIWLTDFLKSLFIPMRYKTNTAFFSIWISLKMNTEQICYGFSKLALPESCSWNRSKHF
jgi:hypothetical protein